MFESIKTFFRSSSHQAVSEVAVPSEFGTRPLKVTNKIFVESGKLREGDFNREPDGKEKGSRVISPFVDRWKSLGNTNLDVMKRYELYRLAESIFDSEPLAEATAEKFAYGAIGKQGPVLTNVDLQDYLKDKKGKAIEAVDDSDLIRARRTIARLWSKLDVRLLRKMSLELYQFGNLPIRLEFEKGDEIENIVTLPPHAFQINSDSNHKFTKGQKDCYVQFDPTDFNGAPAGTFSENEIVFARYGAKSWNRYGFPPIFRIIEECQDLKKDIGNLSLARDSLMPEIIYLLGGPGKGLDTKAIDDFRQMLTNEKLKIGFLEKFRRRVLTGGSQVSIANPGVDYVNKLDDLIIHSQRICVAFNVAYALIMQDERISDRVYQFLLETLYYHQSLYTSEIEFEIIRPIIKIALDKIGIDISKLKINILWYESQIPTRLQAKADAAIKFAKTFIGPDNEPVIDMKSARELACAFLNLDISIVSERCENEAVPKEVGPESGEPPNAPSLQGDVLSDPETKAKYAKNQAAGTARHTDKSEEDGVEPQIVNK